MEFNRQLILASQSPRRLALLQQLGISPVVVPSAIDEAFDAQLSPEENVLRISERKAKAVARLRSDALVLAADTTVVLHSKILGKPEDEEEAVRMLQMLSGQTHMVHTGFAVINNGDENVRSGVESTKVTFRSLPLSEIKEYVKGGSPMDKAGAYGIQDDYGAVFVTRIEGCFYNVMGLPLASVFQALNSFRQQEVSSVR